MIIFIEMANSSLVFVHGGPGLNEYLEQFFSLRLSEKGFHSIFYQQKSGVNVQTLVQQLNEVINSDDSNKCILVGHSWGVALALETLKQNSHLEKKISGLILIDGFISSNFDLVFSQKLKELGIENSYSMEDIFLSPAEREIPEVKNFLNTLMSKIDNASLESIYEEYISKVDLTAFVKNLKTPTLVIYGSEDVRVPLQYHKSYVNLFSSLESLEILGAGHFPFMRKSDLEEVVNKIVVFAKKCNERTGKR